MLSNKSQSIPINKSIKMIPSNNVRKRQKNHVNFINDKENSCDSLNRDGYKSRGDRSLQIIIGYFLELIRLRRWLCEFLFVQIMSFVSPQCAAQSLGPANELFGALVQTILAVQCAISAPENWYLIWSISNKGFWKFWIFYVSGQGIMV